MRHNAEMSDDDVSSPASAFEEELAASFREHSALPYLFVGSGLSRRYLGLPDWEGMLRAFAKQIDVDFQYMVASSDNDLPSAAALLAEAFHPIWWTDPVFESQRKEHKDSIKDTEGALKLAVAEFFREHSTLRAGTSGVDDPDLAAEVAALKLAVVDGVITTNYDTLLEQIFEEFEVYVGQDELLLSDAQFVAETYKIHGSCLTPSSLVLTKGDYEKYHSRNHYLAAKLLTIFAEHPVVFVGYSLTDQYIREIIELIALAVGPSKIERLQKQIYFVDWNPDPATEPSLSPYFIDLRDGTPLPAQRIETNTFLPIFQALGDLERPFPVRVLRELRKHVFDLVAHPDPDQGRETVRVVPFDSAEGDGLRVVFGVGQFSDRDLADMSNISGRSLTRDDLVEDLLGIRDRKIDAGNALLYGLPSILARGNTNYLPVFKYLAETGRISSGKVTTDGLPESVRKVIAHKLAIPPNNLHRFKRDIEGKYSTPRQIMDTSLATYFKWDSLAVLDPGGFDLDELRDVLVEEYRRLPEKANTGLYRAIARYDRLRYSGEY